MLNLDGFVKSL